MDGNLGEIVDRIDRNIMELDLERERALKSSREIVRKSAALIMDCHRGVPGNELVERGRELHGLVMGLKEDLRDRPSLYFSGFVEHAQAEAAEAGIVLNIRLNEGSEGREKSGLFPDPEELGVRDTAYLKGLGDVLGELRRFTLERLRTGDLESATWYYDRMDEIYSHLIGLGHSHVSSDLRKKMDTGRVLLERTLGELVNVKHMASLEREMRGKDR